jgi:Zn ribbon nucleic-acid-binding protein
MNKESELLTCTLNNCGKEFKVIPQEMRFYELKKLPLPSHCPACRHKHRMALRSERQLYRRNCDCCKESMLSTYPKEAPYKIYCQKCFWENIN